jgi:hypothetical protein
MKINNLKTVQQRICGQEINHILSSANGQQSEHEFFHQTMSSGSVSNSTVPQDFFAVSSNTILATTL